MNTPVRQSLISFTFIVALVILTGSAHAGSSSNPLDAIAGDYVCEFDSDSGYLPPGSNSSVRVGGLLLLDIDKGGALSSSWAVMFVGNAATGSECSYGTGTGSVGTPPTVGSVGNAALNFTPDTSNGTACPTGDGTLEFGASKGGLEFVYENASGFTAHGDCDLAGPSLPKTGTFQCSYTADGGSLGNGSGTGTVFIVPKLNQAALARFASISGKDVYPSISCPYVGLVGVGGLVVNEGGWNVPTDPPSGCSHTPFEDVKFTATATTIKIRGKGLSNASCSPVYSTLLNGNAGIDASPSPLKFGSTTSQTLTIKSTGSATLNLQGFALTGPFNFDADRCPDELVPGDTCPVVVTTKGNKVQGQLAIFNDAAKKGQTVVKLSRP